MYVKVMVLAGNQMIAFPNIRNFINPTMCPHRCIEEANNQTKKSGFPPTFKTRLPRPKFEKQVEFWEVFFWGGSSLPLNLSVKYLRLKSRNMKPLALSLPEIHLPGDAQDSRVTADEDHSLAWPPEWGRRSYKTVKVVEKCALL